MNTYVYMYLYVYISLPRGSGSSGVFCEVTGAEGIEGFEHSSEVREGVVEPPVPRVLVPQPADQNKPHISCHTYDSNQGKSG